MTPILPAWLDKPFLETALQGGEEKEPKVTVKDFSAVLAVAAGNNYTSQILRVKVNYRTEGSSEQSTTLIVKAPHANFQGMEELGMLNLYVKEPLMYSKVLPEMKEKIKHDFGPTTYYSTQKNVLVLQDLKDTGYIMCDKFKQLDYAHCELVFKTLAKFHATSVTLHNENPEAIEKIGEEPIYTEDNPLLEMMKPLVGLAMGIVMDVLKKTEDSEPTMQLLISKQEKLFESLIAICKPKKTGLNVANHGDLWNNNILFKHTDSGEVVDVKFIDYQAVRYMTPAVDILYFTWTSADEDVRESRLHQLYDVYLETLNDSLAKLGCAERYTSEELWQDMKSSVDFALAVVCMTLPLMLAEPEDAFDMSELDMKEFMNMTNTGSLDSNMLKLYNGKQFKAKVPKIIKQIFRQLT